MTQQLWHPHAKRIPLEDAGTFTGGGRKFCAHTTEPGETPNAHAPRTMAAVNAAVAAYREKRAAPHFTLGLVNGERVLLQHIPINRAARALQHTLPPETNRANTIQCEIVEFAARAQGWPDELYHYLHLLILWTHRHFDVPMVAHHPFPGHRFSGAGWVKAEGLVGHCHCPGNTHVDPGHLDVNKALHG